MAELIQKTTGTKEPGNLGSEKSRENVESVQHAIATKIASALRWVDDAVDNVAMNIGDAVVDGVKASFSRLRGWRKDDASKTKKH